MKFLTRARKKSKVFAGDKVAEAKSIIQKHLTELTEELGNIYGGPGLSADEEKTIYKELQTQFKEFLLNTEK